MFTSFKYLVWSLTNQARIQRLFRQSGFVILAICLIQYRHNVQPRLALRGNNLSFWPLKTLENDFPSTFLVYCKSWIARNVALLSRAVSTFVLFLLVFITMSLWLRGDILPKFYHYGKSISSDEDTQSCVVAMENVWGKLEKKA